MHSKTKASIPSSISKKTFIDQLYIFQCFGDFLFSHFQTCSEFLALNVDKPIIHRDIKSSNILLTNSLHAKVTDFGFSRFGPTEHGATHVQTRVKGTIGYLDPEYFMTAILTDKSDVFSFGVLLVEMMTGRHPMERKKGKERITAEWVSLNQLCVYILIAFFFIKG